MTHALAIYITGPMTGLPDLNRPAFHAAADAIRERWASDDLPIVILNPATIPQAPGWEWADYMRLALRNLSVAEAVFELPGAHDSEGARLELHVARALGLPILRHWHLEHANLWITGTDPAGRPNVEVETTPGAALAASAATATAAAVALAASVSTQ